MMKALLTLIIIFASFTLNAQEIKYSLSHETPRTGETIKIFFFTDSDSTISLSKKLVKDHTELTELAPGLLLISSDIKDMNIDGSTAKGIELQLKSFKAGTITIPEIEFAIETRNGLSSSTVVETFPGFELEFESSLKNKKLSPLLGKIKKIRLKKQIPLLIITILLLLFFIVVWKVIKRISNSLSKPKAPKPIKINLRSKILKLKDSELELKAAYFELSNLFKLSIEKKFDFNASQMHAKNIAINLKRANADETQVDKIQKTFESLKNPKFDNPQLDLNALNQSIDSIVGIIDEF